MKTNYSYLFFVVAFLLSLTGRAQTLNQSANWPNTDWTVTGTYSSDVDAFESDPTVAANFAFDDDDAGSGSDDSIAAESPVIDMTAIHAAGEMWLTISVEYVFNKSSSDVLEFQYWDADAEAWVSWDGVSLPENANSTYDDFCSGTSSNYTTEILDITDFTATQLSGFQYRVFYDDNPSGGSWGYGFCVDSPTIVSATPPTCLAPTTLTTTNITMTSADLGWTVSDMETAWDVYVVPEGDPAPNATTVPTDPGVTTNPYTKSGLTLSTNYDFYVRADCGTADGSSVWTGPEDFYTTADCSTNTLGITSTTDDTITCKGTGNLSAVSSGTGSEIYWYDAASGGNIVGVGPEFQTPFLETTTSYWAREVLLSGNGVSVGQGFETWAYGSGSSPYIQSGLAFTATDDFTLISVEVFSSSSGGDLQVALLDDDNGGEEIATTTVTLPAGTTDAPVSVQIPLNFEIEAGDYRLVTYDDNPTMMYEYGYPNVGYPFPLGDAGEITSGISSGSTTTSSYYYFYNWTIDEGGLDCQSPLVEATATISTDGDVDITALPYNTTDDTANYGDTFNGASGSGCGSDQNYLNGDDVIYTYTSAEDDVLQIELSGLTDFYGGVFVYGSCDDIGVNCLAGAVAGPSDDEFGITEFHTTAGETYYIVISSWLTPSVGYTLDVKGFDCATFEAPLSDADQAFGAGDTLTELEVETTMSNTTVIWFSDAAGTTEIPMTTALVDGTTYYAGQQFVDCVSALVAITAHEADCASLEILSTTGDEVACRGEMTLEATGSGTGSDIYWYNAASGGSIVGIGEEFNTPNLVLSTSYWASEVYIDGYEVSPGHGIETWTGPYNTSSPYQDQGLAFTATESFTIVSVDVYSGFYNLADSGGTLEVKLVDATTLEQVGSSYFTELPQAIDSDPELVTLMLNFVVPGPGEYYLYAAGNSAGMKYEYSYPDVGYPFPIDDVGEITSYVSGTYEYTSNYYYFYNWTIGKGELICESPRVEVEAVVVAEGDVNIDELPYTSTNNTTLFGNDFSGVPGSGCGTSDNYLAGDDVVYLYSPAEDDILDIKFEDLTGNGTAGLFIYNSCGQIGVECIEGMVEDEDSASFEIQDFYVTGGMNYFFVISTSNGDPVGYTLEINGFDCANAPAPSGEAEQAYTSGDMLADLEIEGNSYNEGFIWYSDEAGTTVIPDTTPLADGTTYYVSQTVLGCESTLLPITVHEFDCTILEVVSTTEGYICNEGTTVLTAEGGSGNKIYWYDALTGGNLVGVGQEFETPSLTATTSYYASEVFVNGSTTSSGYGMTVQDYDYSTTPYSDIGLVFTAARAFNLVSVDIYSASTGEVEILLIDADSGDQLDMTTVSLPGGSNTTPILVTVPLDFEIPDVGEYRLVAATNTNVSMMYEYQYPNVGYPFEIGLGGTLGQITSAISGTYTNESSYNLFYNWTVEVGEIQCGSDRMEAMAIVNTEATAAPTGLAEQKLCEGQILGDIVLETEGELVWYTAAVEGVLLPSTTVAEDGVTYYASQIIEACESAGRYAVTITVDPISPLPDGYVNQAFVMGDVLADFEVEGTDLIWYADEEGTTVIPNTTPIVDQETYYVSQTVPGSCESLLLSVTAQEVMSVDGSSMADVYYYPNPVRNVLKVGNSSTIDAIEIYNLLGQRVLVKKPHALQTSIDVSALQSGTYLMRVIVISEGKAGMFKIIKN